jgi:lipopolysaccharide transport system ATP-binding protein
VAHLSHAEADIWKRLVTEFALNILSVSKVFRIWKHPRDMLIETITGRQRHTEFKALNDVSLSVKRGAIVGILGRNGAGKSTLLRIVAGTLDATAGRVDVNGRIAAILELGSGFHPEYSGRDNIRLGGMCLGMSDSEIRAREDEIIDFSELREFIDQPFRTYSSGMQSRLTFAVATAVTPDILIIDEALSVGDARFQLKSFDRVREFKAQGKTILLVSHDINAVNTICDEAILLERGTVRAQGTPSAVGNVYHELLFSERYGASFELADRPAQRAAEQPQTQARPLTEEAAVQPEELITPSTPSASVEQHLRSLRHVRRRRIGRSADLTKPTKMPKPIFTLPDPVDDATREDGVQSLPREHRYGNGVARIVSIEFRDVKDNPVRRLESLETYDLVCGIDVSQDVDDLCFGFLFRDRRGTDIFGWDSRCGGFEVSRHDLKSPRFAANERAEVRARFRNNMAGGSYFLTVALAHINEEKCDLRFDAMEVEVAPTRELYTASVLNLEVQPGQHSNREKRLWRKVAAIGEYKP